MKNGLKRLIAGIGLSAAMLGIGSCPLPTTTDEEDNHRSWADIEYVVQGIDGTPSASNITYGRIDGEDGNWVDDWNWTTGSVSVPWTSGINNDCTGHWIRLGASTGAAPAKLRLIIKDDGKVAASKDITILGKLDYYITTLK